MATTSLPRDTLDRRTERLLIPVLAMYSWCVSGRVIRPRETEGTGARTDRAERASAWRRPSNLFRVMPVEEGSPHA